MEFFDDDAQPDDERPSDLSSGLIADPCNKCRVRPKKSYGGRGKRPTTCVECSTSNTRTTGPRVKGANSALAAQATAALTQLNNFTAVGLMMMQMHATAGAWSSAVNEESFKASIYEALVLDPELCKWICRGGVKSGKVALFLAYAMGLGVVVPVAALELKMKKAEREAAKAAADAEQEQDTKTTLNANPIWSAA